jgi:tRNA pseudouridine38-40 synthase
MRQSLSHLAGTHDFSAFRGSGCGAKTTKRTIYETSLVELNAVEFMTMRIEGEFIKFRFEGDAFLRHMVRNMVGTIVEVGKGKIRPEDIAEIIESKDRRCAGPTAPAQGLFLEQVFYSK